MFTQRWHSPAGLSLLLGLYIVIHVVLRLALSDVLLVDDAQQVIFSQTLSLGYNATQPPLYSWLAWPLFKIFGPGLAALTLLKYSLLALTYAYVYKSGRLLFKDDRLAAWCVLSFLLISPFAWRIHEGFTHTVLLSLACIALFFHLLRLRQRGMTADYWWLGIWLTVGLLSKYGFLLFFIPLLIAALGDAEIREKLTDRRLAGSIMLVLALTTPHFIWLADYIDIVEHKITHAARIGPGSGYLQGLMTGIGSLIKAIAYYLFPLWLVLLACFPRAWRRSHHRHNGWQIQLMRRFFLLMTVLLLAMILAGITNLKSRWMHPFLLLAPFYVFLHLQWMERAQHISRRAYTAFGWCILIASLLVVGVRIAQVTAFPQLGRHERVVFPMQAIASGMAEAGFRHGTILASNNFLAAHLLIHFPASRAISLGATEYIPPQTETGGQCLLVWQGNAPPPGLLEFARQKLGAEPGQARFGAVSEPLPGKQGKRYSVQYALIPVCGAASTP